MTQLHTTVDATRRDDVRKYIFVLTGLLGST